MNKELVVFLGDTYIQLPTEGKYSLDSLLDCNSDINIDCLGEDIFINGELVQPSKTIKIGDNSFLLLQGESSFYSTIGKPFIEIGHSKTKDIQIKETQAGITLFKDKIDILPPPQKEKMKKGQLMKMIIPPLVMLCVIVVVSVFMKRGLFILMSIAGMMMSVIFSATTYFSDKKDRKEKEVLRVKKYKEYLLDRRKALFDLYNRQKDSLMKTQRNI